MNEWVALIMGINGQHMDESPKTMMSALMGYSDEWKSDKKVQCIGNLNSLTETDPSIHEPT